jgi:hypothetical protein
MWHHIQRQKAKKGETSMLRKTFLAIATVATLSVAALTPAAAHGHGGHGGHWGRGWGFGGFGGIVVIDSSCYQWVRGVGRVYVCG